MTFKNKKYEQSPLIKDLLRNAFDNGSLKEDIVKTASAKKIDVVPTDNLSANLIKLCSALRESGYTDYASELENNFINYKRAEVHLYNVHNETGDDIIDQAHPDGSAKIKGIEGDNVVETISDVKKKILDMVAKKPVGKLAAIKRLAARGATNEAYNKLVWVINNFLYNIKYCLDNGVFDPDQTVSQTRIDKNFIYTSIYNSLQSNTKNRMFLENVISNSKDGKYSSSEMNQAIKMLNIISKNSVSLKKDIISYTSTNKVPSELNKILTDVSNTPSWINSIINMAFYTDKEVSADVINVKALIDLLDSKFGMLNALTSKSNELKTRFGNQFELFKQDYKSLYDGLTLLFNSNTTVITPEQLEDIIKTKATAIVAKESEISSVKSYNDFYKLIVDEWLTGFTK